MKTEPMAEELTPPQRPYLDLIKRELQMPKPRQMDVAAAYAQAINMVPADAAPFWIAAHAAIKKQWPKGLKRLKGLAWRYFEASRTTTTTAND